MAQHMGNLELAVGILLKVGQLIVQQDITLGLVGVNDTQLRLIALREKNARKERVSRREARTADDHGHLGEVALAVFNDEVSVAIVDNIARRSADLDLFAERDAIQDIGHGAAGLVGVGEVRLHREVKGAIAVPHGGVRSFAVIVPVGLGALLIGLCLGEQRSCGRVAADEHPVLEMEANLDVLARSETEEGLVTRQVEGVRARVFGDFLAVDESYGDPSVLLQSDFVVAIGGGRLFFGVCFGVFLDELRGLVCYHAEDAFCKSLLENETLKAAYGHLTVEFLVSVIIMNG